MKKVELGGTPWNSQWDQIIEKALPPEMLSSQVPRGVRRFCPRFYEMGTIDKRTFWAYFFQALAGAEAGLNPNTSVRHSEPEGAIAMRSEGLLQLSYADQKRYGCDFNWQVDRALKANDPTKTILQPKNNLECGVKILVNQIIVQHKPLLTRSGVRIFLPPPASLNCREIPRSFPPKYAKVAHFSRFFLSKPDEAKLLLCGHYVLIGFSVAGFQVFFSRVRP
jgi:hypothetical protein